MHFFHRLPIYLYSSRSFVANCIDIHLDKARSEGDKPDVYARVVHFQINHTKRIELLRYVDYRRVDIIGNVYQSLKFNERVSLPLSLSNREL